ncbi:MAG: ATP-grasp domain-containing protein [Candidatus Cloacimonetes bacterium]|jgi:carbamoyl-phosphate synthase large subunit|nr:ATP-grasp domain-containing protein [Candidatus Cloacimonadota bacterium]
MKNILITSAGKRVSLVKAFQKELKEIFPNAKVYAADANPKLAAACIAADGWFEVPRLNSLNYINELITICLNNSISLIVPTIDTELLILSENEELLKSNSIKTVISSKELIKKCRDKRLIHNFFESKGVEVAKEFSKDELEFPLFIKPSDGSRSVDTFVIENRDDLTEYHFQNEKFMFLEYLNHSEYIEYTCDLYYGNDSNLKCVVPRKRIEVRDGEVNKGKTENNELVKYIKGKLRVIEGAKGCLTVQFFIHHKNRRIVGIEINPRFGGGFPLTYLAGGNYPKWIIKEYFLGEKLSYFEDWEDDLLMLRYDDEILVHGYKE